MSREPTFGSSAIRRQFSELAGLIDDELGAAFILEKDRLRFDVFHEQVANVTYLSDSMVSRSHHLFDEDDLSVRMVSLNDIFLFKAVANREDDVEDMIRIAQAGIDEDIIVKEVMTQLSMIGNDEFVGSMRHKLDRLEAQGFDFNIHQEVNALYDPVQNGGQKRNYFASRARVRRRSLHRCA